MPSILYGGVRYSQTRHAIYCKKCETTIESKSTHDFKMCPCGAVGVDGGIGASNRVLGNMADMKERSMYRASVAGKKLWLPQSVIEERFTYIQVQRPRPTTARLGQDAMLES